jgi:hypothetical protein
LQLLRKMDTDRQIRSLVCSDGANHRGEEDRVQPFDGSGLNGNAVFVGAAEGCESGLSGKPIRSLRQLLQIRIAGKPRGSKAA